jgi:hypothetical protein
LVNFNEVELDTCLIAKTNMGWLWNRRLAHVGMKNLHKLLKGEQILELTNVHFEKDRVCSCRYPETRVPLLLYKDKEPAWLSLSRVVEVLWVGPNHSSPQSQAAILDLQQRPTPPHGRVRSRHVARGGGILQSINSESGPPWESAGPLDIQSRPPRLVPDPRIYSSDLWGWSRTSTYASRTLGMGSGPPVWGPGRPQGGSQSPRIEHTRALNRTQAGVRCRHVSRPSLVQTCLHTLLLRAQVETRCCHVAYCA